MHKKVIIIGATSGIGRKMAELYADKGCRVGITGRRKELLDEIQKQHPEKIEIACFDVTGTGNTTQLNGLMKKIGGMDILVISAGTGDISKELDWQLDKITIETNVNGFVEIANWAFNFFLKQGHGSLATISSIASHRGNSWAPAYSASKAFQSNYFEGLAMKAHRMKKDISITCIEPGFVNTKMAKGNKMFWVVPVEKAALQIINAIEKKKRQVYVSKRWWLVGKLLKWAPYWLLKRIV